MAVSLSVHVREHAHEGARGLAAAARVALGQVPEEHGREEHLAVADRARQRPEHPGRARPAAGIDLVGHVDVALRDAAGLAPQSERAGGHELVQLLGERDAADAVEGVRVGDVDLMKFLGGSVPGCRHVRRPPFTYDTVFWPDTSARR